MSTSSHFLIWYVSCGIVFAYMLATMSAKQNRIRGEQVSYVWYAWVAGVVFFVSTWLPLMLASVALETYAYFERKKQEQQQAQVQPPEAQHEQ